MENNLELEDGVQFDPGFIKHMSAIIPNIEYAYNALGRIKSFNQKKQQFKMFYPKILTLLETYMSFYAGSILWAVYIKTLSNKPLLNNICYGGEYDESEILSEVDFVRNYLDQLKKDVKYYTGQDFTYDPQYLTILEAYKEFLKENKGFVNAQTTDDIVIPKTFKTPDEKELDEIFEKIYEVNDTGKLKELLPLVSTVI